MRYILSIFLFSILIQNIITEQDILDRMARAAIALRNIVKYKQEQMRKLQVNTYTPDIVVTVPTDLPEETILCLQIFQKKLKKRQKQH